MLGLWKVREFQLDFFFTIFIVALILLLSHVYSVYILTRLGERAEMIVSISVTLLGFLVTSLVILLTFPENYRIKFIKKHPTYPRVFQQFLFTIFLFLGLAILSFVICLFPTLNLALVVFAFLLLVWSIVSLVRCLWILKKMIDLYFSNTSNSRG